MNWNLVVKDSTNFLDIHECQEVLLNQYILDGLEKALQFGFQCQHRQPKKREKKCERISSSFSRFVGCDLCSHVMSLSVLSPFELHHIFWVV